MRKFVFKYTFTIWLLLILVSAIFAAATAVNLYDAIVFFTENRTKSVFALIVALISAVLLVSIVSAIVYGRYVVKGKYLYFHFGLFFTKTEIGNIFQITEFKAQQKLVMYYNNEKYSVILIDEKYYNDFYEALRKVNSAIIYTVQSADEN